MGLLCEKERGIKKEHTYIVMRVCSTCRENNKQLIENIEQRFIDARGDFQVYHELIYKHLKPSDEEKKNNAEFHTPPSLIREMLDKVPSDFWTEPHEVLDPCCGKGGFVVELFRRFDEGFKLRYPQLSEIKRRKFIIDNLINFWDISPLNVFLTQEILRVMSGGVSTKYNGWVGDSLTNNCNRKFDLVVGNPPYSTDPSKPDSKPLYDKFIEKFIDECKYLLFVIPSRWFLGGKNLDKFRKFMINRKDIRFIIHENDETKWFGNSVQIKGGVNYFLKDSSYDGICDFNGTSYDLSKYDCVIDPKHHNIVDIINEKEKLTTIYYPACWFKHRTNDNRLRTAGSIKCYVSKLKSKDRVMYIDTFEFNEKNSFWKVITPEAAFKSFSGFGEKFIGKPDEIHTDSYISFRVNNEEEAKSLVSYLETDIVNYLLSIRKISQHITEKTCKYIPLVPFDRIWTDESVKEYLGI
jgi:site-specific DNA-methyltransferase (adenine-specific)